MVTKTRRPLRPIADQKMKPPAHVYEAFLAGRPAGTNSVHSDGSRLWIDAKYGGLELAAHGPDGLVHSQDAKDVVFGIKRIDAMIDWHAQGFRAVLAEYGLTISDEERVG